MRTRILVSGRRDGCATYIGKDQEKQTCHVEHVNRFSTAIRRCQKYQNDEQLGAETDCEACDDASCCAKVGEIIDVREGDRDWRAFETCYVEGLGVDVVVPCGRGWVHWRK